MRISSARDDLVDDCVSLGLHQILNSLGSFIVLSTLYGYDFDVQLIEGQRPQHVEFDAGHVQAKVVYGGVVAGQQQGVEREALDADGIMHHAPLVDPVEGLVGINQTAVTPTSLEGHLGQNGQK